MKVTGAKPLYEIHFNHCGVVGKRLGDFIPFTFFEGNGELVRGIYYGMGGIWRTS